MKKIFGICLVRLSVTHEIVEIKGWRWRTIDADKRKYFVLPCTLLIGGMGGGPSNWRTKLSAFDESRSNSLECQNDIGMDEKVASDNNSEEACAWKQNAVGRFGPSCWDTLISCCQDSLG